MVRCFCVGVKRGWRQRRVRHAVLHSRRENEQQADLTCDACWKLLICILPFFCVRKLLCPSATWTVLRMCAASYTRTSHSAGFLMHFFRMARAASSCVGRGTLFRVLQSCTKRTDCQGALIKHGLRSTPSHVAPKLHRELQTACCSPAVAHLLLQRCGNARFDCAWQEALSYCGHSTTSLCYRKCLHTGMALTGCTKSA